MPRPGRHRSDPFEATAVRLSQLPGAALGPADFLLGPIPRCMNGKLT